MNLDDINWDYNEAGNWPPLIKFIVVLVLSVLLMGAWVYYDTLDQLEGLEKVEKKELGLKKTFETKQEKAVNLEAYKHQLVDMRK